jgi:ParB-like chromosome segregation protein Spo0J
MADTFNLRDHLAVHPAADLFPLMSESELEELAEDIRENGLQQPIVTRYCRETRQQHLIDGVNRLDALALLGWLGPPKDGGLRLTIPKEARHH